MSYKSASRRVLSGSAEGDRGDVIGWELRPGGMLVQKREPDATVNLGPLINVKVSHGLFAHDVSIPSQATFGVKDKAKIILVEDPASRERRIEEMRKQEHIAKACKSIAAIRSEVDKLAGRISDLERNIANGTPVTGNEFGVLSELLMRQLLKLDGIEADGEAKAARRTEVKRVQSFVEVVDGLKVRNSNPKAPENTVVVTTQWETFDNGMGSLMAPPPATISTFTDWERFD